MTSADIPLSVAASLGAAAAFGLASALQHGETGQVERRAALDPGLLTALARRPLWLLGTAADVAAVLLQAVALRFGPVSLVQGLLVAGLPLAVALSALLAHRRLSRDELRGIVLCSAGLALLLPVTTASGLARSAHRGAALAATGLLAVVVLLLLAAAKAAGRARPAATGAAAGAVVGAGNVLLSVAVGHLDRLLTTPATYAAVAVGLLGLLLSQAAFQTGALGAPLAALSIVEPLVAVLLAVTILHERLPTDPRTLVLGAAGALLAVAGILVLSARDVFA